MQTELSMNPGIMQSEQDIYTYSNIQSQLSSFTIGTSPSLQTIVVPPSAYNLARSLLSFKMSLVAYAAVANSSRYIQRLFHCNTIPFFREIKITSGGTQILHLQRLQYILKVLLPYRKQDVRFVTNGWLQKQYISFVQPSYNFTAQVNLNTTVKQIFINQQGIEQIQSYLNRSITVIAGTQDISNISAVNNKNIYTKQDSVFNILPYTTCGNMDGSAIDNFLVQIRLSDLCPFTFLENDQSYKWSQGLQIELQVASIEEIYFIGGRPIYYTADQNAADTAVSLNGLLNPACTTVPQDFGGAGNHAAIDPITTAAQNITVSNFGLLIARPTVMSKVQDLRNHQMLVPYIYIDYQTGASNLSFSSRVGPQSRGSALDLQFLTFFQSAGANAHNWSNSGLYNNAVKNASGAAYADNNLNTIEVYVDNTNVLQISNVITDLAVQEFVHANTPFDRIPKDLKFYYEDALSHNFAIPFKYYHGDQLLLGKDALTKEVTLSFNANLSATDNKTFTFYLISIFTRMMIFDQFGNIQLI